MDIDSFGRQRILARIRRALSAQRAQTHSLDDAEGNGRLNLSGVFPPIEDPLTRFREECEANRTELHLVTANSEAHCLREILEHISSDLKCSEDSQPKESSIFIQDTPDLRRLTQGLSLSLHWSSDGPPRVFDSAGITLAEALVARTGSVLISAQNGGRAASVLSPLHIVYAQANQLVSELGEAFERVQNSGKMRDSSMLSLITGPSRTSDIEKMLVLGAQGPRRLIVLLRSQL